MRTKSLGVLVAFMLVVGACGAASQPSSSSAPGSPSMTPPAGASDQPAGSIEPAAGPVMTDTSLGVEVAASGLTEPTALAFLGTDDFFVTEKSTGQVHHVTDGR